MVKEEKKTIQLGLRIDKSLLKEIEYLSESEGVDKMSWIKRALADFVNEEKDSMSKEAVKDYIGLVIDENDLKKFTEFSKIPKDIEEARKEVLNKIKKGALEKWEYIYNYVRPHQALGYLTPMEFYRLWKVNPQKAYEIAEKYQAYLKRQRIRLANSRRIKKREQIEKLMQFIDAKLNQKVELKPYKLELIKCELCSWG